MNVDDATQEIPRPMFAVVESNGGKGCGQVVAGAAVLVVIAAVATIVGPLWLTA